MNESIFKNKSSFIIHFERKKKKKKEKQNIIKNQSQIR